MVAAVLPERRNVRVAGLAMIALVVLAGLGAVAARQIRSPAQIAADAAAPAASLISVPVERRSLATEVIVRGTVRYGAPQEVTLPVSALKTSTSVVSTVPKADAKLGEGAKALVISGRPVFVLRGATPMHRDLGPGSEGRDVRQLEQALARGGFSPGSIDGRYDGATAAAVAAMYAKRDEAPFGPTDIQADQVRTASAATATARDALLQTRVALRTAERGATAADVNQARLDASAAAELVPPARAAITAARDKAATAQGALSSARLQEVETASTAGRDIAVADADVTTKAAAVGDAIDAQAEAQRQLAGAAPDVPPNEFATLRAAVRSATQKVAVAQADLTAAQRAADAARAAVPIAIARARNDARLAARQLELAGAEARDGHASLAVARHKLALARARVGILRRPPDVALERRIVASSQAEAARTQADLARLALRTGVQVPADEVVFFPTLPVRVDSLTARRGSQLSGSVMTVSNSRLAIDSSLSLGDAKLVRRGLPVRIEEQDLGVRIRGAVSRIADKPGTAPADLAGTTPVDPARTYVEVLPGSAPPSLVGTSVKLSIAVESTKGRVLAVPIGALSVAADGRSRVQVDLGGGRTRFVTVSPGLAAQGFVEVTPTGKGRLKAGDLVVVGSGPSAAAKARTGLGTDPAPSPGSSPAGAAPGGGGPATTPTGPGAGGTATTPGPAGAGAAPAAPAPPATPTSPATPTPPASANPPATPAPPAPASPSPTAPGAPGAP